MISVSELLWLNFLHNSSQEVIYLLEEGMNKVAFRETYQELSKINKQNRTKPKNFLVKIVLFNFMKIKIDY